MSCWCVCGPADQGPSSVCWGQLMHTKVPAGPCMEEGSGSLLTWGCRAVNLLGSARALGAQGAVSWLLRGRQAVLLALVTLRNKQ